MAEAVALLRSALAEHRAHLAGPRPPDPTRRVSYEALLRAFEEHRGGPLFYPYLGSGLGRGTLVELADGSVKYDFISGIGVHALGHSPDELLGANLSAAMTDTVMQGNLQSNEESADLARLLLSYAGERFAHVFLASSGAMANENALKIILQRRRPATRFLAFERAFAGRTLALLAITDNPATKEFLPTTLGVDRIPFFDADRPEASTRAARERLEAHLAANPGAYAGMHVELIQGEAGSYPGSPDFFRTLFGVLRDHGIAVWIDEIQTLGRTDSLFAFRHLGLDAWPDVVTLGKLAQVAATIVRADYRPRPGLVSQTCTSSTSAILAARAILDHLQSGEFFGPGGRIERLGARLREGLGRIAASRPDRMAGPFGYGAMAACTVCGGDLERTKKFLRELFEAGVIAFYAGTRPARVRFLPSVGAATGEDVDAVCDIFERVLCA